MNTNVVKGERAKQSLTDAINILADSIEGTLGVGAKNVLVAHGEMTPRVLNDGVSIVNAVKVSDPATTVALDLLRSISREAQRNSGDGTTTATILARAMLKENLTDRALADMVRLFKIYLEGKTKPVVAGSEALRSVAYISANNDSSIGNVVADVFDKIGENGVIHMASSNSDKTYYELKQGITIPSGFVSPAFAKGRKVFEAENPMFVLGLDTIEDFDDITGVLEIAVKHGRPIVFFVKEMKGVALSNLIANTIGGIVNACVVRIPRNDTMDWISDVHAVVGGEICVGEDESVSSIVEGQGRLGFAKHIKITEKETTIIAGEDMANRIKEHADTVRQSLEYCEHEFEIEKTMNRLGRLENNMATIYIAGFTESEVREARERVDDCVNATRLALKGGVVVGGGVSYLGFRDYLFRINNHYYDFLLEPIRVICKNAGVEHHGIIDTLLMDNEYVGYAIQEDNSFSFLEGESPHVLDPTIVVLNSFRSAISIVKLINNTDTIITDSIGL